MSGIQFTTSQGGENSGFALAACSDSAMMSTNLSHAVARHLGHESEIVRSQAARALATVGSTEVADMLQALLTDEDPDVRVDAMSAFVQCARAEDAGIVRQSLIGDPEFYVKKSALSVLARLKDTGSVNLLCSLACSRCNGSINWDESVHGWDEWLDLQPSVVRALATIGDDRCIETLLSIREDEFALDLDEVVFKALLQLGDKGIQCALQFLDDSDPAVRAKAINVFAGESPEHLSGHLQRLLCDSDTSLRLLAVNSGVCEPANLRDRMLHDPDAVVRIAAVEMIAARYEPAARALFDRNVSSAPIVDRDDEQSILDTLNDTDERVRLAALSLSIRLGIVAGTQNDFVTNEIVSNENFPLAQFPGSLFLNVVGNKSEEILSQWLADEDASTERRIYAAKTLSQLQSSGAFEALSSGLIDKVSQVRVACLEALVSWTHLPIVDVARDDWTLDTTLRAASVHSLSMAISGEVFAKPAPPELEQQADCGANTDQPIAWYEHPGTEAAAATTPLSTLAAIEQANQTVPEIRAEGFDDASIDKLKRDKGARRRVSVSGPDQFEEDLRCLALTMCSQISDCVIERETLAALEDPSTNVVEAALRSLHGRYRELADDGIQLPGDLVGALMEFMDSDNPGIRYWAASVLLSSNGSDTSVSTVIVAQLMNDTDTLCRSLAMQHADKDQLHTGLSDSSSTVRNAAVDRVLLGTVSLDVDSLMDILVENNALDTLRRVMNRHEHAMPLMARRLDTPEVDAASLIVLLGSMTTP